MASFGLGTMASFGLGTMASFGLGTLVAVDAPPVEITGETLPDDTVGTHVPQLLKE
jgi:hypothetical protein